MLKKGHLYKVTFSEFIDGVTFERSDMIFSPRNDILYRDIDMKFPIECECLFHINLGNMAWINGRIGMEGLTTIERPHTEKDFEDIEKAVKLCGLSYNKEQNKIEGYDENYIYTKHCGRI